jgi:hypothetical protein
VFYFGYLLCISSYDGRYSLRSQEVNKRTVGSTHNTQSNKIHCIVPRYFILQYHVEHSYIFRSRKGTGPGLHAVTGFGIVVLELSSAVTTKYCVRYPTVIIPMEEGDGVLVSTRL